MYGPIHQHLLPNLAPRDPNLLNISMLRPCQSLLSYASGSISISPPLRLRGYISIFWWHHTPYTLYAIFSSACSLSEPNSCSNANRAHNLKRCRSLGMGERHFVNMSRTRVLPLVPHGFAPSAAYSTATFVPSSYLFRLYHIVDSQTSAPHPTTE